MRTPLAFVVPAAAAHAVDVTAHNECMAVAVAAAGHAATAEIADATPERMDWLESASSTRKGARSLGTAGMAVHDGRPPAASGILEPTGALARVDRVEAALSCAGAYLRPLEADRLGELAHLGRLALRLVDAEAQLQPHLGNRPPQCVGGSGGGGGGTIRPRHPPPVGAGPYRCLLQAIRAWKPEESCLGFSPTGVVCSHRCAGQWPSPRRPLLGSPRAILAPVVPHHS